MAKWWHHSSAYTGMIANDASFRRWLGNTGSSRRKLIRSGIGGGVIKVSATLINTLLTILLARALGAEGYGVYAYVFSLVAVLAIPAQSGLPILVLRETATAHATKQWGLLRGIWRWANAAVGVIAVVLALGSGAVAWASAARFTTTQLATFFWGLLLIPTMALGNLRGASLRGLQRVVVGMLPEFALRPGFLAIFVAGFLLLSSREALAPDQAMALHVLAAALAFGVGLYLLWRKRPEPLRDRPRPVYHGREWMAALVPLSILAAANAVNQQAGVLILGMFSSSGDVGTYRVAVQTGNLVGLGLATVNLVVAPRFARLYALRDMARLERLATATARVVVLTALPVGLALLFWGDSILGLAFGAEYTAGYRALAILTVGQLVNAGMGSVGLLLYMSGHEADAMRGKVLAVGLNITLSFALIPMFGLEGAAFATMVSLSHWNVLMHRSVRERLGIDGTAFNRRRLD